jgi:hypothetical protein
VVVAPLDQVAGVDVPGEVDQQVAGAELPGQGGAEVVWRDPVAGQARAGLQQVGVGDGAVVEVQHGQLGQVHVQVAQQQRLQAARHRAAAEQQQPSAEGDRRPARDGRGGLPAREAVTDGTELGEAGQRLRQGLRVAVQVVHVGSDRSVATTRRVAREGSAGPQTYIPWGRPASR